MCISECAKKTLRSSTKSDLTFLSISEDSIRKGGERLPFQSTVDGARTYCATQLQREFQSLRGIFQPDFSLPECVVADRRSTGSLLPSLRVISGFEGYSSKIPLGSGDTTLPGRERVAKHEL
jgi:hypothetical protein